MEIKIIHIFLLFLISFTSLVSAQNFFDDANNYVIQENYPKAIEILTNNCPITNSNVYNETIWRCNFMLGIVYEDLALIKINGEEKFYNKQTINISRQYFKNAVANSKLNSNQVQLSDVIFLADLEISTGNYDEAEKILDDLEIRMNHLNTSLNNLSGRKLDTIREIYKRFRSIIAKDAEAKLILENIGSFGFSYIQIDPKITFLAERDLTFNKLNLTYEDLIGVHNILLQRDENNQFIFDKTLLLTREGIFPFDSYITIVKNIKPERLRENKLNLSIFEPTILKGYAEFKNNEIYIKIYRDMKVIIFFYLIFSISLVLIIFLNKSIKNMKTASFPNILKRCTLLVTIFSLIYTLVSLSYWKSFWNIYTYILFGCILLSIIHLLHQYHKLRNIANKKQKK
ncbi:hypothetical protein HYT26_03620 [Candidatus Pacearchaeota archaeon]|nr:hypothetical protein [Candidatus Pacearchaeota archaeon]